MNASPGSFQTPVDAAVGAQFAPLLRLALSTLAFAVGGMFAIATARTATAFEEPHSYPGRFTNREFYADYSPTTERSVQVISVPLDSKTGVEGAGARTIDVDHFGELSSGVLDAVEADAAMHASDGRAGTDARNPASATPKPAKTQTLPASQAPPRTREPVARSVETNAFTQAAGDEPAEEEFGSHDQRPGRSASVRMTPTPVARSEGVPADFTPVPRRTPTPKVAPPTPTRGAARASTPERARGEATPSDRATAHPTPATKRKPAATPTPRRAPTSVKARVSDNGLPPYQVI